MGVVERFCDSTDDVANIGYRHAIPVRILHQLSGAGAVDVVHRNLRSAIEFTAVMHSDDVRAPKRRGEIRFPDEPFPKFRVGCYRLRKDFEHTTRCWLGHAWAPRSGTAASTGHSSRGPGRPAVLNLERIPSTCAPDASSIRL